MKIHFDKIVYKLIIMNTFAIQHGGVNENDDKNNRTYTAQGPGASHMRAPHRLSAANSA